MNLIEKLKREISPGLGVTKPISPVPLFSDFSALWKHTLDIDYHVNIWQVSSQLQWSLSYMNVIQRI